MVPRISSSAARTFAARIFAASSALLGVSFTNLARALAADPPVTRTTVEHQGRSLQASRIRVDPYLDDPARSRYPKFATRFYTLILSKDIPGEIYQLRAELIEPGQNGAPASVIESEVLTFENEE